MSEYNIQIQFQMDKEALKSKIVAKLGSTTLSDRTISDYAGNIVSMITDDAQVTDAYIEAQCNILKSLDGQLHNDVSAQVSEWKKNNPTPQPNPQPEPKPTPTPSGNDAILEQLKKMQEGYDALNQKFNQQQSEAVKNAVKEQVINTLKAKIKETTGEEPNGFILKTTVAGMNIGDNPDVEAIVKGMTDTYNANLKEAGLETSYPNAGGGGGKPSGDSFDSYFQQKAEEGKFPKGEKS